MIWVAPGSEYKTVDEMKAATDEILFGATDLYINTNAGGVAFAEGIGLENVKAVTGFTGQADVMLSVMRGEVDYAPGSDQSYFHMYEAGDIFPIAAIPQDRSPLFPDIPTIYELSPNMPEAKRKWVELISSWCVAGLGVYTTPGVPADRLAFLRDAFSKSMNDPDLLADAEKINYIGAYLSGADYKKLIEPMTKLTTEEAAEFLKLLDSYVK